MELIDVKQGSAEWLALRKDKIGASEVSIIMGKTPSEWKQTPLRLWRQKLGLESAPEENEAMREGKRKEPIALAQFNKDFDCNCIPVVGFNPAFPWLIASLDGWDGKIAVEIKCGGQKLYLDAMCGVIPEYYNIQMQTQMLVFGLLAVQYYVYFGDSAICFAVLRDHELCAKILVESKKFWDRVQNLDPPDLTDRDYVQRDEIIWRSMATSWKEAQKKRKEWELIEKEARDSLIYMSNGQSSIGGGIRLSRIISRGRLDYDRMIEDYEIENLEKYRKEPTEMYRIGEVNE